MNSGVVLVVLIAGVLVSLRGLGITPYAVLSGSMAPTYPVGSLILVQKEKAQDFQVDDPVTFVLDQSLTVVTHRIVEIDRDKQSFITRGDANNVNDGTPVYFENVIGKPIAVLPFLGYVMRWVSSPAGMIIVLGVVVFLIGSLVIDGILEHKKKENLKHEKA